MFDDTVNADRAAWAEPALLAQQQSMSPEIILRSYAAEKTGHERMYDDVTAVAGDCLSDSLHALCERQGKQDDADVTADDLDLTEFVALGNALYPYVQETMGEDEMIAPFDEWLESAKRCFMEELAESEEF